MPSGRKKIEIDWDWVDEKLANFWEGTEIAAHLGIHKETLYDRVKDKFKTDFSDYKAKKRAKGKAVLRELQLKTAMEGNVTMQIFLGKQYLDQADKQQIEQVHEIDVEKVREKIIKKLSKDDN